jgi:hypothetical protein
MIYHINMRNTKQYSFNSNKLPGNGVHIKRSAEKMSVIKYICIIFFIFVENEGN